jgi:hypothetical protein
MAFFSTDDACADCGADAFAATDILASGVGRSREDAVPLCFACYVERLDRVRACGVVEVGQGEFVAGAPSVEGAENLAHRLADELSAADLEPSVENVAPLTEARDELGNYHARELARAARSETRHVYAGTSERGTVVDVETRTDPETREEVRDALTEYALDGTSLDVRKRDDVYDAVVSAFPTLVEHGTTRSLGVERTAWELAKERGVSRGSERSAQNKRDGREFEECFRGWCDERNLEVHRGKGGLVRYHPDAADEIVRKTDGLAGVPDFLVRDTDQDSFGSEWRPDGDTFVEVKRGTSTLSREQQGVVAHLKALDFDVYVLRGEPDEYRFERR